MPNNRVSVLSLQKVLLEKINFLLIFSHEYTYTWHVWRNVITVNRLGKKCVGSGGMVSWDKEENNIGNIVKGE